MSPLLNLSDADASDQFEALDSGTYPAEVFEVTDRETKGGEGSKMPKGTPMMNVQYRLFPDDDSHAYHNRRVFQSFVIPPQKIDGKKYEHYGMMMNQILRFLIAIGYDEAEVKTDGYETDYEDMKGRPCRVTVGKREYPVGSGTMTNDVKGVKPPSNDDGSGLL